MKTTKHKTSQYNYSIDYKGKKLLFNGVTGAGFCMTNAEMDVLLPLLTDLEQFQAKYPDDFERLEKLGYIISAERNELEYLKFKHHEMVFLDKNYRIFVNPTLDCNFRCWYCYQEHPKGYMSEETMNRLKKHLKLKVENKEITSLNLSWFGGEPLLYFYEVVYPLAKFAKELCEKNNILFISNITTNGYLMDEEMIKKMNEIGLHGFQITLDGHRERHNKIRNENGKPSYDKIIENINLLYKHIDNVGITLRINYDNQTLKNRQAEAILNDIEPENRKKIHIDLQHVWQTAKQKNKQSANDVSNLIATAKNAGYNTISYVGGITTGQFYNCYVSKYYHVEINYDGKVYKCTARDYTEPYEMGEMSEDGTIKWNEDRISKLYGSATFDNPICRKCAYLPLCWGPCAQKMVDYKEAGIEWFCMNKNMDRTMSERIIDTYESSINKIKQHAVM